MYEIIHKLKKVKWTEVMLGVGVVLVVIGLGISYKQTNKPETKVEIIKKKDSGNLILDSRQKELVVEVGGAVIKPGVYKLAGGSRVNDVLVMAGGLAAKADRDWVAVNVNKAATLVDGQKIYIPDKIEKNLNSKIEILNQSNAVLGVNTDKINLNTADLSRLDTLEGIGPAIGQKIIDYRNANGGFRNIEEIKLVSGIGDKLYEKIKDKLTI